jgi:DNA-binding transcriptional LysR family regulator
MDFRELQYVVTVADCQSITAASKKLYISQPSLSYALNQIEKEVGVRLFDRSHQPISLTEAGRLYVRTARTILREKTELKNRISDLKEGSYGQINLGIPSGRSGYMIPPIINQFRNAFPNAEFLLQEGSAEELMDLLNTGKISFMIAPWPQKDIPFQIKQEIIFNEPVYLVAAKDAFEDAQFSDKEHRIIDLKKISAMPYIGLKKGHSIHRLAEAIFNSAKIRPTLLMEVENSYDAVLLASCGLGYTFVAERTKIILGDHYKDYFYNYSEKPVTFPICAMYKEGSYLNKAERAFIDMMKVHFGK